MNFFDRGESAMNPEESTSGDDVHYWSEEDRKMAWMREIRIRIYMPMELKACWDELDWLMRCHNCPEGEYPPRPLHIPPDYIENLQSRLGKVNKGILPPTLKMILKTYYHLPAHRALVHPQQQENPIMPARGAAVENLTRNGEYHPLERPQASEEEDEVIADGVGGGNGDVDVHGDGDGAGAGTETEVEMSEGAQDGNGDGAGTGMTVETRRRTSDGNGDGNGDGSEDSNEDGNGDEYSGNRNEDRIGEDGREAGMVTGVETRRRTPDGNGDGNGDGSEDSSVDGNGDEDSGNGNRIGEGGREAKKRKKPQNSCRRHVGNERDLGEKRKTCRKEGVGPVAANPDNLESNKEAGGGAQGAQGLRIVQVERVYPLCRV